MLYSKRMDKIDEVLTRGVEKIYPNRGALEKVLRSGKKIRLYQGFDPSTPNLHIGHLVGLLKLAAFQKLGHEVIFLIGDFTAMIGDPTGKIKGARPMLTRQEVLKNVKTYKEQAGKILNFSGKNPAKLKYNSTWLGKLNAAKVAELMRLITYAQIIERDMFQERIKRGKDIYLNELFYPLLQAYDSVHMDVDLEIGGSDQMFNMMVGRDLMKKLKGKEKFVMTTKLLVDSQGNKIGKTEGNVINIAAQPFQFYSQIMSLPDEAILPCFELITNVPLEEVKKIKQIIEKGENSMIYKKRLAFELTKMLNNKLLAIKAQKEFERVFQKRRLPSKIGRWQVAGGRWNIVDLLMETKLCSSRSEAKRLVKQGGVEIDNKKLRIANCELRIKDGMVIRAGKKRFIRLKVL